MDEQTQDRTSVCERLDRAKPEQFFGGVLVRALIASGLWYTFDDALANATVGGSTVDAWSYWQVLGATLFLCVIVSSGGIIGRRSD